MTAVLLGWMAWTVVGAWHSWVPTWTDRPPMGCHWETQLPSKAWPLDPRLPHRIDTVFCWKGAR